MDAQTEVSSVRISHWYSGLHRQVRAEWTGEAISDELVHYLLDFIDPSAGGSIEWLHGFNPVSVHVVITVGNEEIPF